MELRKQVFVSQNIRTVSDASGGKNMVVSIHNYKGDQTMWTHLFRNLRVDRQHGDINSANLSVDIQHRDIISELKSIPIAVFLV